MIVSDGGGLWPVEIDRLLDSANLRVLKVGSGRQLTRGSEAPRMRSLTILRNIHNHLRSPLTMKACVDRRQE